jgi:isoleucyl-tRNA synthetase
MSPILAFTAAEAWNSMHGIDEKEPLENGIYFLEFPVISEVDRDDKMMGKWETLMNIRSEITKALEIARREKVIGHPLEAEVLVHADDELSAFLKAEWNTVKEISIVSELSKLDLAKPETGSRYTSEELPEFIIQVQPAPGEKCERCWIRSTTVGQNSKHPQICKRCVDVVTEIEQNA